MNLEITQSCAGWDFEGGLECTVIISVNVFSSNYDAICVGVGDGDRRIGFEVLTLNGDAVSSCHLIRRHSDYCIFLRLRAVFVSPDLGGAVLLSTVVVGTVFIGPILVSTVLVGAILVSTVVVGTVFIGPVLVRPVLVSPIVGFNDRRSAGGLVVTVVGRHL